MTSYGFKQWVAWRYPFELVIFGSFTICRADRILVCKRWQFPVGLCFVSSQYGRRFPRFKGMRNIWNNFQMKRHIFRCLPQEACNRFRDNTTFLRPGATFNQHLKVEFLGCKSFKGVLANSTKLCLINIFQETVFQVFITQTACIIIPEYLFYMGCREDFTNDIKHGVIVKGITDFLQFFE